MSLDSYSYLYGLARSALLGSLVSYWRGMVVWSGRVEWSRSEQERDDAAEETSRLSAHGATLASTESCKACARTERSQDWLRLHGYPIRPTAASLEFRLLDLIARYARHCKSRERSKVYTNSEIV